MDEPLASLDEARKAEILPYIERLRDESKVPIVYVSHSVAEVARLASTIVLLSEGKVAAVGPTPRSCIGSTSSRSRAVPRPAPSSRLPSKAMTSASA
jgi:ABC-type molybdate transport system ATPase subunit